MTEANGEPRPAALRRELAQAFVAADEPGAGSTANLECRLAALQQRFIAAPARDLADIEARLIIMRDLVRGLGAGYLLDLVSATLDDVRALRNETVERDGCVPTHGE